MGNNYTTSTLVEDVQLLSHMPLGNNTFDSKKIIRLANFELQTPILSQILASRGGYYLDYSDLPIVEDGLYSIPSDAIAGTLANVELVVNPTIIPVNPIVESEQFSTISPTSTSYGYFMKGNFVQILPVPNVGVARLWYLKRPGQLIPVIEAGNIILANVDITNMFSILTVSSLPSTMMVGTSVDVIGDQPPFNVVGNNLTITSISGTDVTLSGLVPTVQVGDWLCLNNQTPVPAVPVEYRILLAQRTVCKVYELQDQKDKLASARALLLTYEKAVNDLITQRVKSGSKIISTVNGGFVSGNPNRWTNFAAAGRQ